MPPRPFLSPLLRQLSILSASVAATASLLSLAVASPLTWDIIAGNGSTITDGAGTWVDNGGGWNTGSGDAVWSNNNPDVAIFGAGGTAGLVTISNPIIAASLTFNPVGGSYTIGGGPLTLQGPSVIQVADELATITSVLQGASTISKEGPGTLVLDATNGFTSALQINAGTVRLAKVGALGTVTAGTTVASGASLELATAGTFAGETLTLNGPGVGAGGGALLVSTSSTWSGAVQVASAGTIRVADGQTWIASNAASFAITGPLTKTGGGTLTLTGGITTGTGGLLVQQGTVLLPDNTVRFNSGPIIVSSGGLLQTKGTGTDTIGGAVTTLTVEAGGAFDFGQTGATEEVITALRLNGTGQGDTGALLSSLAGATSPLNAPITIVSSTSIGVTDPAGIFTVSGKITGSTGTLTKVGPGTLRLIAATQAFTGPIVISGGTISMANTNNASDSGFYGAASVTIKNATLRLDGGNNIAGHGFDAKNFVPVIIQEGGVLLAAANTSSHARGLLTLLGGTIAGPGPVGAFGTINLDGGLNAGGVATTSVISAIGLTNSQTGGTIFNISSGASSGIDLDYTGTLEHANSVQETVVIKKGTGTMRMSGTNTYLSGTAVQQGKLLVNGSNLTSSFLRVSAGATLGGSGRVSVVQAATSGTDAGEISPGEGAGILTATSVQGDGGLRFSLEMKQAGSPLYGNAAASGNDLLHLVSATPLAGGNLTSTSKIDLYFDHPGDTYLGGFYAFDSQATPAAKLQSALNQATFSYFLRNAAGTTLFNGGSYLALAPENVALSYVADPAAFSGGSVVGATMQFVVVPEPASAGLWLLGAVLLGSRRRHRR